MSDMITIAGVNIQWPWSELLLDKKKFIETRSYALPKKHEGSWLALIETPGREPPHKPTYPSKSRITGLIKFSGSISYPTESEWIADFERHKVPRNHPVLGFRQDKPKWGWVVEDVLTLSSPLPSPAKKGIVFASCCVIPEDQLPEDFKRLSQPINP